MIASPAVETALRERLGVGDVLPTIKGAGSLSLQYAIQLYTDRHDLCYRMLEAGKLDPQDVPYYQATRPDWEHLLDRLRAGRGHMEQVLVLGIQVAGWGAVLFLDSDQREVLGILPSPSPKDREGRATVESESGG